MKSSLFSLEKDRDGFKKFIADLKSEEHEQCKTDYLSVAFLLKSSTLNLKFIKEVFRSVIEFAKERRELSHYTCCCKANLKAISESLNKNILGEDILNELYWGKYPKEKEEEKTPAPILPQKKGLTHPIIFKRKSEEPSHLILRQDNARLRECNNEYLFSTIVVGITVFCNSLRNSTLYNAAFEGLAVGCISYVAMQNKDKIMGGVAFVYSTACSLISGGFAQRVLAENPGAAVRGM